LAALKPFSQDDKEFINADVSAEKSIRLCGGGEEMGCDGTLIHRALSQGRATPNIYTLLKRKRHAAKHGVRVAI
jgi:hypothetical protein